MTVCYTWFHEMFRVLPADASEETVRIYARAYILICLRTRTQTGFTFVGCLIWHRWTTWGDIDRDRLHWPGCIDVFVVGQTETLLTWPSHYSFYSLGFSGGFPVSDLVVLMCSGFHLNSGDQRVVSARLSLDRLRVHDFVWEPYSSPKVAAVVHLKILVDEHRRLWTAITSLIYFVAIEWHQVDRVVLQFGSIQHLPQLALNIDWLHVKDGRGGDRWFPRYYQEWHLYWENRVDSVIPVDRVADPGPSAEYLDWWCRVAHRFLSPDVAFHDPRPILLTEEARHRGSSRVDQRRRIGTRATDREWRLLDDRLDEDLGGADDGGVVNHCVPRRRARRQGGRDGRGRARGKGSSAEDNGAQHAVGEDVGGLDTGMD
ncbi:hypothetical protein Ahy_A02g008878 [Arachis hypogaea]|uniref:Aminotransferase-like plant mobile domain-containing protein n=1 Tax=Arachis hypogaea TaxID=3818 RepID=A0A445EG28_ARAHY|nr:hypothetical protein Ahy_A02g008878 [Arachis hypogaea]